MREDCGLLAYAPLGAGSLSGKYLNGARPAGSRFTLFPDNRRYQGPHADQAVAAYIGHAREQGLDPIQMALAYVLSRPFLTSAIIGATKMPQLETSLAAQDMVLAPEVLEGIEKIHKANTYPCP